MRHGRTRAGALVGTKNGGGSPALLTRWARLWLSSLGGGCVRKVVQAQQLRSGPLVSRIRPAPAIPGAGQSVRNCHFPWPDFGNLLLASKCLSRNHFGIRGDFDAEDKRSAAQQFEGNWSPTASRATTRSTLLQRGESPRPA